MLRRAVGRVVLLFTLAVTLLTVVLFGVAPAIRGARTDLHDVVKSGWRSTRTAGSRRLADAFVIAQFALSIVLLVGAGLLLRSLSQLMTVDPGFRPENVLVGRLSLPWIEGQEREQNFRRAIAFYAQLEDRVRALPGVRNVGASSSAPFSDGNNQQIFVIKGREPGKGSPGLVASVRGVTTGYFGAVGTTLRRGRLFEVTDTNTSPPVVIVDETLARRFWADGNAIGHQIRLGDGDRWRTIVGVVASVKHGDLGAEVLGRGMGLALVGIVIGLIGALGVTRYLGSLLFHVKPFDPVIFTVVTLLLVAVALAACYLPARRATATDPLSALRAQ